MWLYQIYLLPLHCLFKHFTSEKGKNYTVTFLDIFTLERRLLKEGWGHDYSITLLCDDCQQTGINTNFWTTGEKFRTVGHIPLSRRHPTFLTCLLLKIKSNNWCSQV